MRRPLFGVFARRVLDATGQDLSFFVVEISVMSDDEAAQRDRRGLNATHISGFEKKGSMRYGLSASAFATMI
jgi:hypothetical protein